MGALQNVIGQVLARLRDINASQRVALMLGGALVAVSLIWLVQWAAKPEMVPLLEQDLQPEELTMVRAGLETIGEPFEVNGSRVLVRGSANRQALLAQLQQQEKLPANTSAGFAALVQASDPWISQQENNRRWTYALQEELRMVLRQLSGVRNASVFLNLGTQKRSFTRTQPPSSASVTLVMKHSDRVPRALALAAARLVSGAVAGLPPRNVQVVDGNGMVALDWDSEQDPTNQLDRKLQKEELRYANKLRQIIPDQKALISVQVELDTTTRSSQVEQPLKGEAISEETTSEKTVRGQPSAAPGVKPNTGLAIGSGGLAESHEKDNTRTELQPGLSTKTEATPAGGIQKVTAAISLSYSYLEDVFRRTNPDVEAPDDQQIEGVFQREQRRLLAQVVQLVKPQVEENVAISRYYDTAGDVETTVTEGSLDEALGLLKEYGPQSGLGLLALLSLGMMLRMAKRRDDGESFGLELGLPKDVIKAAQQAAQQAAEDVSTVAATRHRSGAPLSGGAAGPGGEPISTDAGAVVEQAAATEGMLVAQEVSPGAVQTRKMIDQVVEMIDEDSEAVSTLVEQWIQRNEQYRDEAQ